MVNNLSAQRVTLGKARSTHYHCRGFTLIEMVVGMVILAIAMTIVSSMLAPLAKTAMEPVRQMRASELGNSLMQEVVSKSFDENSDHNGGGLWRCGDSGKTDCTDPDSYGPDGESRTTFDDVDDYDTGGSYEDISNALDDSELAARYTNFSYLINVVAVDSSDSQLTGYTQVKRIDLTLRTSSDEEIDFSVYRWNY